jgi:hypothetical protein
MRYRVVNVSTLPVVLPFANGAVTLKKRGDSAAIELSQDRAQSLARHGIVRFEAIAAQALEPKPATADPRKAFAPRNFPAPENPQPASQPAADEPKETR